ncbi:MAG: GNAT family N-acetyltransferase [Rhizobiaceae bacterium]
MLQTTDQPLEHANDGEELRHEMVQPVGLWRIETIKSAAEIRDRAHEWLELERNCIDPFAPFQSYAWCESWAATFCGKNNHPPQPRIFFIYRGKTLVAILPMMVSSHRGAKVLTLFGEPHSQIANALTRAGVDCTDGLRLCMAEAVLLSDADVVALGPLPQDSPLTNSLEAEYLSFDPAEHMSLVTWPGIWQPADYVSGLKRNRRKDYNRKFNRLKKLGTPKFNRFDAFDREFKPLILQALELKKCWLERNGMLSVGLSQDGIEKFLSGFVPRDGGYGVEVVTLSIDGKTIAIGINLVGSNMRSCYLSAYDPDYSDVAPGMMLDQFSIQNAIEDGMSGMNFLGYPTPHKNQWATDTVPLQRYQQALTFRGRIWLNLWIGALRPAAKLCATALRSLTKLAFIRRLLGQVLS